jgi:hypothetical protein
MRIRLLETTRVDEYLHFSIEIENDRREALHLPTSLGTSEMDKPGEVIRFRELLLRLGTSADDNPLSFKAAASLESVSLFGNPSVVGSTQTLVPGETIRFRLRVRLKSDFKVPVGKMRVRAGGWDIELRPADGGYRKIATLVPSLFVISKPVESKNIPQSK